jgi:hypothetical protein
MAIPPRRPFVHTSLPAARKPNEEDKHFMAYGQSLGFTGSKFSVDITSLRRRDQAPGVDLGALYATTFAPPPDYSKLPISMPVNTQDLDQFFHRERWIEHLDGMTLEAVQDLTSPDDESFDQIKVLVVGYFGVVQKQIKRHASHDLLRKMAQVGRLLLPFLIPYHD